MQFLIYQVPVLGNGMLIALDAVLHVVISHGFAIGVLSLVVLAEYRGWRRRAPAWEAFAHDLLRFTIVITTGIGAITGVGIWFLTSALEPRGIGSLLRIFFWPWFVEWFAFTGEVIAVLAYYYTWKSWGGARKGRHVLVGALYLGFALASAFLITGILGFMLTPDGWPWEQSLWRAFFNPTFLSQLLLRLSAAYALGGIFALAYLLLGAREEAFRREAARLFGRLAMGGAAAAGLCAWWYFAVVPSRYKAQAIFSILTSALSQNSELFWIANAGGAVLLGLLGVSALRGRISLARALVIPTALAAVAFVGEFERVREFIRGPYVMPGYMYANQVLLEETSLFGKRGVLANSYWYNAATAHPDLASAGRYLFAQNCSVCHTIGGANDIVRRVQGRPEDGIAAIIGHTEEMVPFMPPFSGTAEERRLLARYLHQIATGGIATGISSRFIGGE